MRTGTRQIRDSRKRRVILEELRGMRGHPTAPELHEAVRRILPRISLGTVYRNLELLAALGLVRRLDLGGDQRRFDAVTEPHYHVRCTQCGSLDDVCGCLAQAVEAAFRSSGGYEITGCRLELTGLCPNCKGKSDAPDCECQEGARPAV